MKVLLVSSSSGSRGGGELYQLYLAQALRERGHEVSLWMSTHERMDELERLFTPIGKVIRAPYKNTYDYRFRSLNHLLGGGIAKNIAAQWKALAPDVIHLNKQNLEDCLDLLESARLTGIRSVATIHITQDAKFLRARYAAARDWVSRRFLRRFPGVLVPTLEQRERELRGFVGSTAKIKTVINGVPMPDLTQRDARRAEVRAELNIAPGQPIILAVGRVVPQKRPMLWLDWAEKLHREIPDAQFVWVGSGELAEDFDRTAIERKLPVHRVAWTNDVPLYLLAADAFMHTAEFEGLSFALLEALSAALPILITENLLAELPFLTPEVSIALADNSDWKTPLKNPDHLATLAKNARTLAEEKFSFARMARDYEAVYGQSPLEKN
jgi:glycosyltransferase involved in cell wall biosynthesis